MLSDGAPVSLRPIRPGDSEALTAFHNRQSPESIYFRYFRFRPELSHKEIEYFTNVDYEKRMAFVATIGEELVAVARYESGRDEGPYSARPEVAFFVDDAHHGRGLATLLLEYLAAVARQKGLEGFSATVLPDNYGMLRVFRKAGFEVTTRFADGAIEVSLGIEVTPEAAALIDQRGRRAQARSIARILEPKSVAVVGAGRRANSVGYQLALSVASAPFAGSAYAVNPAAAKEEGRTEIAGLPLVGALEEIDGPVDLAVVAVPASAVEEVVEACAAKGVTGLVVVSAGFSDEGHRGQAREKRLAVLARKHGMRLIGPASFGVVNTNPTVGLRALFAPAAVSTGSVAVLSQSGPLGAALLDQMSRNDVGVSSFVAVGNRADVSTNDLLQYWAVDQRTKAICLYQPNIGNPRNFARIARHVVATKPIIAVEPESEEIASLLRESGVIVVDRVSELVEQAKVAVSQPLPLGDRVAVVSNASSVASLAAAACRREGLKVVVPSGIADSGLADAVLVGDADTLRVPRRAAPSVYEQAVVAAALSEDVHAVLVALVPTLTLSFKDLGELLARVDRAVDKPMVATGLLDPSLLTVPGLPCFTFPEQAARALGRMATYAGWRSRHRGPAIEADDGLREAVEGAVAEALSQAEARTVTMADPAMPKLLKAFDLPMAPFRTVQTEAEAVAAADALGYPVVLKAANVAYRQSGEKGGTALDLMSAAEVALSFRRMMDNFADDFLPAVVQATAPAGAQLAVRLSQDSLIGARLSVGVGGESARSVASMSSVLLPAGEADLDRLVSQPWLADLLAAESTKFVLRDVLSRLAAVADASPDVAGVTFNPLLASETDSVPVEAEISLRRWPRDPLAGVRHL